MAPTTLVAGAVGLAGAAAAGVSFRRFFDRDPDRALPAGDCLVAPADGRVLAVTRLDATAEIAINKGLLGRIRLLTGDLGPPPLVLISIFMSPLVVHVQRAPVGGRIRSVTHREGRLRITNTLRALDNERAETVIETPRGNVKVVQIAGVLARRIETWVRPGEQVSAGARLGRIRLGSQVSMFIPASATLELLVRRGDRVTAGETVLARYVTDQAIAGLTLIPSVPPGMVACRTGRDDHKRGLLPDGEKGNSPSPGTGEGPG